MVSLEIGSLTLEQTLAVMADLPPVTVYLAHNGNQNMGKNMNKNKMIKKHKRVIKY